jgi:hypothetical protein
MWCSVVFYNQWSKDNMFNIIVKWWLGRHRFRFKFKASIGWFFEEKASIVDVNQSTFNDELFLHFMGIYAMNAHLDFIM